MGPDRLVSMVSMVSTVAVVLAEGMEVMFSTRKDLKEVNLDLGGERLG